MSKERIKQHFRLHYIKYIDGVIILIILSIFLYNFIPFITEESKPHDDTNYWKEIVESAYEIDPSILTFDKNNVAVLKMDILYSQISKEPTMYPSPFADTIYTKDFDQCAGYIIVKKNNDNFDIDLTHMCDMLDY